MATGYEFAICDVETTGFGKLDRIVEIAIIRVNQDGAKIRDLVTLVNPDRDLGPTHVHGIMGRDLYDAPKFSDIAGDVVELLAGAVFTAHNAAFDARMIRSELTRLGVLVPDFPKLCTMELASCLDPFIPNRSLNFVCSHFGIQHLDSHSAEGDAIALVELLRLALGLPEPKQREVASILAGCNLRIDDVPWPELPKLGKQKKRNHVAVRDLTDLSLLQRLVSRLPSLSNISREAGEYFTFLDRILEDRRITEEEIAVAQDLASELGLYKEQIGPLHEKYLNDLVLLANADGTISEFESRDLCDVARLLGIDRETCERLIGEVLGACAKTLTGTKPKAVVVTSLIGKTICFTGEFQHEINGERATRDFVERLVAERGLLVRKTVTKDLDYLVVGDPDSMSSKAKKARQYGIQIIAEPVFWKMIGNV